MNNSGNLMITINVILYMGSWMTAAFMLCYRTVGKKVMNWLDKKDQELYGFEDRE